MKIKTKEYQINKNDLLKLDKNDKNDIIIYSNSWTFNNKEYSLKYYKNKKFKTKRFKYVYYLIRHKTQGHRIILNFWQNQLFLFLTKTHWLQKEENIRYIINILFLIGGLCIGLLNYFK